MGLSPMRATFWFVCLCTYIRFQIDDMEICVVEALKLQIIFSRFVNDGDATMWNSEKKNQQQRFNK